MNEKIIKLQNLYALVDFEPFFILVALAFFAWAFYKMFLGAVTDERHKNIQNHIRNLFKHSLLLSILFTVFEFFFQYTNQWNAERLLPYLGLVTFIWGIIVFVKASRLLILQYLFLGSMKTGVPVLIVNIYSLALTVVIVLWATAHIFGLQLGPLLATSAAFSIVLGLALQDTLGNLFAGISLQLDKSFEIGDWIEIQNGSQKITGQVKEITWRATILAGWSDEVITLPNRLMANSQISNFQNGDTPFVRSQYFRISFDSNIELAKKCLLEAVKDCSLVLKEPGPACFVSESSDSWVVLKVAYFIANYGSQFSVGDQVFNKGLQYLKANNIESANQIYKIKNLSQNSPQISL